LSERRRSNATRETGQAGGRGSHHPLGIRAARPPGYVVWERGGPSADSCGCAAAGPSRTTSSSHEAPLAGSGEADCQRTAPRASRAMIAPVEAPHSALDTEARALADSHALSDNPPRPIAALSHLHNVPDWLVRTRSALADSAGAVAKAAAWLLRHHNLVP